MIRVLALCDGMSIGKLAFDELGIKVEYWAVEIDGNARALADFNIKGIFRPVSDLLEIKARHILLDWPVFDYVLFGSPCQSLSISGDGTNFEGKSKLFFDCMNILSLVKYRNPNVKFLIENVASMRKEPRAQMDHMIGIKHERIDSELLSAQNRDRLYWFNWNYKSPERANIVLDDVLDDGWISDRAKSYCIDASYAKGGNLEQYFIKSRRQLCFGWSKSTRYKDMITDKIYSSPAKDRISYIEQRLSIKDKSNGLSTGNGCRNQSTMNIVAMKDGDDSIKYRMLTIKECARLQTIPDWFDFSIVSKTQAYKCLGNGWTLEVIKHLLKASLECQK